MLTKSQKPQYVRGQGRGTSQKKSFFHLNKFSYPDYGEAAFYRIKKASSGANITCQSRTVFRDCSQNV